MTQVAESVEVPLLEVVVGVEVVQFVVVVGSSPVVAGVPLEVGAASVRPELSEHCSFRFVFRRRAQGRQREQGGHEEHRSGLEFGEVGVNVRWEG